jgi:hypothetical protein
MVARLVDTREDDDEGFPIFEADVQTTEVTSSAILTLLKPTLSDKLPKT